MSPRRRRRAGLTLGAGALLLLALGIRAHNVVHYPIAWGFDAPWNWEYIAALAESWALPAPDAFWSAAHPPLFYYLGGAVARGPAGGEKLAVFLWMRSLMAGAGLATIALAVALVRRVDPGNRRRAWLAAGLLLFLPVHVYMSAMLSEELLVALWISLVVVGLARECAGSRAAPAGGEAPDRRRRGELGRDLALGAAAGLAMMTKATGALAVGLATGIPALLGLLRGDPRRGLVRALRVGAVAAPLGAWFYLRNLVSYGYLYPHGLEVHSLMFRMPPGDRSPLDYLRFPLETFTGPDLASPPMTGSVWGSTYASAWSDPHGIFLPAEGAVLDLVVRLLLVLGLLPTGAFLVGALRGVRRLARQPAGPDLPLLALVAATLAGYVYFTWRNPFFVVHKASFLLGLGVPFAYYASETLARWTDPRKGGLRAGAVRTLLVAGVLAVSVAFSFGVFFRRAEPPGIDWTPTEEAWSPEGA